MISILEAVERAKLLADSGEYEAAGDALAEAASAVDAEQDRDVLRLFAELCHYWGPEEGEEAALRALIRQRADLEVLERLLALLQQRLNTLKGDAREAVLIECERLGSQAIELLDEDATQRWSNLIHPRGLRRLELAQLGRRDLICGARADLDAYRSWLEEDKSVPPHFMRHNMIAHADIHLAELDLVEDRRGDAVDRLESAIRVLEGSRASKLWIDRAYALLERAYGEVGRDQAD